MSQPPRNKPPIRQVPVRNSGGTAGTGGSSGRSSGGSGAPTKDMSGSNARMSSSGQGRSSGGEPTRYTGSGASRTGGSNRGASGSGGYSRSGGRDRYDRDYDRDYGRYGPPPPRDYRGVRPRSVQSQRDPFPYIMGGIIGALIVGLGLVILLLLNNNKNNTNPGVTSPSNTAVAGGAATAASNDPPRMALADFKALYDDPAKRPLIIDVRTVDTFDAGHIQGAISFPEADVDTRVKELPKDKLIVAYCQ